MNIKSLLLLSASLLSLSGLRAQCVGPLPIADASISHTVICEGEDFELIAQQSPGLTYAWTGPNGFSGNNPIEVLGPAIPAMSGDYILIVTDGPCVSLGDTVSITVLPAPAVTVSNDGPKCVSQNAEFTASATGNGPFTYIWFNPQQDSVGTGPVFQVNNLTSDNFGVWQVLVIDDNGCESLELINLDLGPGPDLDITANGIQCFGDRNGMATVVPTSGVAPYLYSWSPSGQSGSVATGLPSGTQTVTVTDADGCVTTESVVIAGANQIFVNPSTTPSSCAIDDGTATANATGGAGGFTYVWDDPAAQSTATATGLGAGTYTVIATDQNGCPVSGTAQVNNVNPPNVIMLDSVNVSCFGGSDGMIRGTGNLGTPGYTYEWSPSGGNDSIATGLSAGTYTLTVTDAAGCQVSASVTLEEPDPIVLNASATDAECGLFNGTATASASGGTGSFTFSWSNGANTANVNDLPEGNYTVTVTDQNFCTETASVTVGLVGNLDIAISASATLVDPGDNVQLQVDLLNGATNATYAWSPNTNISCTNCSNPNVFPEENTTYVVVVTTADGCTATDSVLIEIIEPCAEFFLPNTFTPNGDGENDELCFFGQDCVASYHLVIFNRWGEIVFESKDENECWNGDFNEKPLNTGSFAFKLMITSLEGEEVVKSGKITLIR
jgi:gliding motility-associated-like protein